MMVCEKDRLQVIYVYKLSCTFWQVFAIFREIMAQIYTYMKLEHCKLQTVHKVMY